MKRILLLTLFVLYGSVSAQSLTLAMSAQPDTLDPQTTAATSAFQVMKSLYDTLIEVDRAGELVPALAASWELAEDGLSVTFNLREGVRFHDGSTLGSEDVRASLERIVAEETASPKAEEFRTISEIETPDELTVVLRLSEPTPALLATLASGWGAILPSEPLAAGHDFGNEPIGTGPFILSEWVRDAFVRLERFDDYYGGAAPTETVTIRFVQDSAVQFQGLLTGEFDIIDTLATADLPTAEANPNVTVLQEPSGLVLVAALNTRRPYLDNPVVRRALNLAVDEGIVLEVAYGGGEPVSTFMEAGSPWYPETLEPFGYDPEEAQQLLEEAGVPADWVLDIVLPQPYEAHIQAGQIVQDMLSSAGVQSEIRIVEWGVWLGEIFRGARDFDITIVGHTGKLDPTGRLAGYGAEGTNYTGYANEEVVELLERAASEADTATRRDLYNEVLTLMHDEAPFIYFGTPFRTHARRVNVEGFWMTPLLDTFDFREARRE